MSDNELLRAIYSDMQDMKADMQNMKADMQNMKTDMQEMKADIQNIKARVTKLEVTLEKETNRNIKLLAENHSTLIDKLNESVKVADKTRIYEIQVNILTSKVEKLEQEVADIKSKIA